MARAEFESRPKPAASHDHTILSHVVAEAKAVITADGTDWNTFADPMAHAA